MTPRRRTTIKQAREAAGLSQIRAAVALGVSEPTYRKYEQDPEVMSLRMAHRLAGILGVQFDDLALYKVGRHK